MIKKETVFHNEPELHLTCVVCLTLVLFLCLVSSQLFVWMGHIACIYDHLRISNSVLFAKKTKQNKTKQNKTKQNKTKQNKTKQNKTKQNESDDDSTHARSGL